MQKALLLVAFLLVNTLAFGQRDFELGYIVQQGDTIHGFVSQKDVLKRSNKVIFKTSQEATANVFTPQTINGYGVTKGDRFEAKQLGVGDTAKYYFFKILVLGATNLYALQDGSRSIRYFVTENGSLTELIQQVTKEKLPNGQNISRRNDLYKETLQKLSQNCPSLRTGIKKISLKQTDLTAFIVSYNECSAPKSNRYEALPEKADFTWGILVGGGSTSLNVEGNSPEVFNKSYTSSFSIVPALQISSTLPWVSRKLSIQLEASYHRMAFNDNLSNKESFRSNEYNINIDLQYLKTPLILRYTVPISKVKPFFNAGIAYSFALKHEQDVIITSTTPSGSTTEHRYFIEYLDPAESRTKLSESFRGYSQSFLIGTGVSVPMGTKHSLSLEARYETGNGFSEIEKISTKLNQVYFLAGFSF